MLVLKKNNVVFTVDEYSGSTFHMSSSAEKEDIKDAIENYGAEVCETKHSKLESELVNCSVH